MFDFQNFGLKFEKITKINCASKGLISTVSMFPTFRNACTIKFSDSFIVTGGQHAYVTMYDENGWKRDFPKLSAARRDHGCGFYMNDELKMVCLRYVFHKIRYYSISHPQVS